MKFKVHINLYISLSGQSLMAYVSYVYFGITDFLKFFLIKNHKRSGSTHCSDIT